MKSTPSTTALRHDSSSFSALRKWLLAFPVLALALAGNAQAANGPDTWVGSAGSTDLNQATWTGTNATPLSGDSFIFTSANASASNTLTNTLANGFTLAGVTYNAGALAYTLTGNSFALTGGITNSGTSLETINNAISEAATQTYTMTTGGGDIALGGVVSGAGGITTAGAGTLTLSNNGNTYTGVTTVGSGTTLAVTGTGRLNNGAYAGAITTNGTLNYGSSANQTLSGVITGSGGNLTMSGSGTLSINPNNQADNYGSLSILSGTLSVNTGNGGTTVTGIQTDLGNGTLTIGSGSNNATLDYHTNYQGTYSNAISINGTGVNTIQATRFSPIFTGAVTLNTSNLTLITNNTGGSIITLSGNISGTGNLITQANANLTQAGKTSNITLSGSSINNTGTITNNGTGTSITAVDQETLITGNILTNVTGVIQNSTTSALVLSGTNTFTADTTLTSGTLRANSSLALQNSTVNMNGGTLAFGTAITAASVGGLAGSGNVNLVNTNGTPAAVALTIGNSNTSYASNTLNPTYSGILSNSTGAASLTKVGTNTQTLSGANTYTGLTTVSAGTLATGATGTFGAGNVTVAAGATLTLGNFTSINDTGGLVVDSTSTVNLNFTVTAETITSLFSVTGSQYVPAGTYTIVGLNNNFGFGLTTFVGTGSVTVLSSVPEPSAWGVMMGMGAIVLIVSRRTRLQRR